MALITQGYDRDNLMFLLNADDTCMKDWYKQADPDDLQYAQELLASYAEELCLHAESILIEDKLIGQRSFPEVLKTLNLIKESK
jgi:hypothetical protein